MKLSKRLGIVPAIAALLILAGCLISGTFITVIIIHDKDFTTQTGFYFKDVKLEDEKVWEEHKDNIKNIDIVGFELWITNHEGSARKFSAYINELDEPDYNNLDDVQDNAIIILDDLPLAAGPDVQTHITYGQSFKYLRNVDALKKLADAGAFDYYGISSGGTTSGYTIDTLKVIVTFSAGL